MDKGKLAGDIIKRTSSAFDKADELSEALKQEYMKALAQLQKEVAGFYARYGTETGVSYTDAVRYLSKVELRPFREKLEEYTRLINEGDIGLLAEIKALDYKEKITRLESLMLDIRTELVKLGITEQTGLQEHLTDTFKESYISAHAGIKGIVEAKASFARLNPQLIRETVAFPWSGQNFSEIIWGNTNKLAGNLKSELTQGFIRGSSIQKMSSVLAKHMDNSYKNALRVVRTESAHVLNKASLMAYEDAGVTHVEFLAVLDSRTSAICFSLNGDIIPIKDAVPGKNVPPLHPNCRSTVIPVVEDAEEKSYSEIGDKSDIIVPDEVIKEHQSVPSISEPNKIVDYLYSNNKVSQRVIYGKDGRLEKSINTTNHGNPKRHPYGLVGEHVHEFVWKDGAIVSRSTRELTDEERKQNRDILPRKGKE